ncbi:MAG: hypothetical protein H8E72_09910 [Candidatus Marinimicrobia bacterium]|nr:hypothetical protein [Candidatus Neomarinimicrobiota bacterium]
MKSYKSIITLIFMSCMFAGYSVGDQISSEHQSLAFDVCYGDYPTDQLSLSDFADGNTVIWLNLAASW